MSTSQNNYDPIHDLILSSGLRIKSLRFDGKRMFIKLNSDQVLVDSLSNYPRLNNANDEELIKHNIIADGTGVHWPVIDEDLSLYGLVRDYLTKNFHLQKELVIS